MLSLRCIGRASISPYTEKRMPAPPRRDEKINKISSAMNEAAARKIVLVRAIENADVSLQLLSEDDRLYAAKSAHDLAQWEAADRKSPVTPALFLEKRAEQILKKMTERAPAFAAVVKPRGTLRALGIALPVLAFLAGVLIDRIGDPHRVDLLSAPLLLIIGWNLAVYLLLIFWAVARMFNKPRADAGLLKRWAAASTVKPRKLPSTLATAVTRFSAEWAALSAPLTQARVSRVVHLSAAALAFGAVCSLYLRGLLSQYQTGWESTFLDAAQVHALLKILFTPATWVFQLPGFSLEDVRALRGTRSAANGALWVHLYAFTLLLLVMVPRLLLDLLSGWKEKKLRHNFPLDLGQPYFRKLTDRIGPAAPAVLRVLPYSFTLDEARDAGLAAVARALLGEQARVMLRPVTAYGDDLDEAPTGNTPRDAGIAQTALLFNLSATPELESHGAFIDQMARGHTAGLLVFIDESSYLERLGSQGGAAARLRERIALWQQFCEQHKVRGRVVNLLNPPARPVDGERI
jgi:Protein of unknown function (DUF2868)